MSQAEVLELVKKKEEIKSKQIARELNLSRSACSRNLRSLVEKRKALERKEARDENGFRTFIYEAK